MRQALAFVSTIAVFAGCSPTIDADSDETLGQSIEEVRSSLDENDRDLFDQALWDARAGIEDQRAWRDPVRPVPWILPMRAS